MARRVLQNDQIVKLIVGAGQASPSPPVGPALGSKGVKSMDFCKVSPAYPYDGQLIARRLLTASSGVQRAHRDLHHRHHDTRASNSTTRSIFQLRAPNTHNSITAPLSSWREAD